MTTEYLGLYRLTALATSSSAATPVALSAPGARPGTTDMAS